MLTHEHTLYKKNSKYYVQHLFENIKWHLSLDSNQDLLQFDKNALRIYTWFLQTCSNYTIQVNIRASCAATNLRAMLALGIKCFFCFNMSKNTLCLP